MNKATALYRAEIWAHKRLVWQQEGQDRYQLTTTLLQQMQVEPITVEGFVVSTLSAQLWCHCERQVTDNLPAKMHIISYLPMRTDQQARKPWHTKTPPSLLNRQRPALKLVKN